MSTHQDDVAGGGSHTSLLPKKGETDGFERRNGARFGQKSVTVHAAL